jgi:hypothetical protein
MAKRRLPKGKPSPPYFSLIIFILVFLALFSAIGLDYISREKDEKSYLFPARRPPIKAIAEQEVLTQTVINTLSLQGISSGAVQKSKDEKNVLHLKVDLPLKKFTRLEPALEKELKAAQASLLKKEEQQDKEKNYFLWQVEAKDKSRLNILFACSKEKAERPQVLAKNKAAIIMDDMGNSLAAIDDVCALKKAVTISILPLSLYAKETAEIAHQNGLEVMLHLPLESINNQEGDSPTDGIIYSQMGEEEIKKTVEDYLDRVPYIQGVNNHMGSKITADEPLMRIILSPIKDRNLFFLDSRTTGKSIAYELAQEMGIHTAYRQVFLDDLTREDYIKSKMIELFRLAQKKDGAVGICHPFEETLQTLKNNLYLLEDYNLELVFASQVVQK